MDRTVNTLTGASRGGSSLMFTWMSLPEAERLLAAVWYTVEDLALKSPIIEVRSIGELVNINLFFESAVDCALVQNKSFTPSGRRLRALHTLT